MTRSVSLRPVLASCFVATALALSACGGGGGGGGGALAAPTGLAAAPSQRSAAATWDAVAGADAYRLYLAADPSVSPDNWLSLPEGRQVLAIRDTSFELLGLEPGGEYWFVVVGVSGDVAGPVSAPASFQLAPDTPKWILAKGGPCTVTFQWTLPRGAVRYDLYVGEEDRLTPENWATVLGGQRFEDVMPGFAVGPVPNGTDLYAVVVAWNDVGRSPTSNLVKGTACGRGTFTMGDEVVTSGDATTSALADVDGDGIDDLVVLSPAAGTVDLFPGGGDGTFGAPSTIDLAALGVVPSAMVAADLDEDGLADLALRVSGLTLSGSPEVWSYLGFGDGTFWLSEAEPLASTAGSLAVARLRGAGFPLDLVVSDPSYGIVGVLLGEGGGGFEPVAWYGSSWSADALVAGDFDGDGFDDVVVADPTLTNVLFLASDTLGGLGVPVASPSFVAGQRLQVVDTNLDGVRDLLLYDPSGTDVLILRGVGDGTFVIGGSVVTGSAATAVSVADVDGDGLLDVVVSVTDDESIRVFLGTSTSTFAAHFELPTSGTDGAADTMLLEDLDGDGALDVVVTHPGDGHVVVAFGSPV